MAIIKEAAKLGNESIPGISPELSRDPEFLQALEQARTEILAKRASKAVTGKLLLENDENQSVIVDKKFGAANAENIGTLAAQDSAGEVGREILEKALEILSAKQNHGVA